MKNIKIAALSIVALTCLTTLFIRIPLPSRGYFNVGDVAVVFGGLVLGFMNPKQGVLWALAACGIGSALADILGGFAVFAPLTFAAKGAEGALAALAASRPANLDDATLARLRGIGDPTDAAEVREVYLPLTDLLSLYMERTGDLFSASHQFLGEREPVADQPNVFRPGQGPADMG